MNEVKGDSIFLVLAFVVGLVIVVVLTYFLNKRIFKKNFIYQETMFGKVKDTEIGSDGHVYVVVEYNINGTAHEAKFKKTKLIPSRKGMPVYIDVNSLDPNDALPHSIIPFIICIAVFIVAIISFIIVRFI